MGGNLFFVLSHGGSKTVYGQRLADAIDVLLSERSEREKSEALYELKVLEPQEVKFHAIVTKHRPSPQLKTRLEQWKRDVEQRKQQRKVKGKIFAQAGIERPVDAARDPSEISDLPDQSESARGADTHNTNLQGNSPVGLAGDDDTLQPALTNFQAVGIGFLCLTFVVVAILLILKKKKWAN